jgi:release factor glutamine methyltransferase
MTIKEALGCARRLLDDDGIEDASFEGELLLRQALGLNRTHLYSNLEDGIDAEQESSLWNMIERRLKGEPSAYIIGHREFYGLDFSVNADVLIPRPETELLMEKALSLAASYKTPVIADIGTGCGAIAISLAVNLLDARIYATDVSPAALEVAAENCRRHDVADRVRLICGDMLAPLTEQPDTIVSNLPYVRSSEIASKCHEPLLALDGGSDGLDKIRHLVNQAEGRLNSGGCLLLEIGLGQSDAITSLVNHFFPTASVEVIPDLADIDRVVCMKLPD